MKKYTFPLIILLSSTSAFAQSGGQEDDSAISEERRAISEIVVTAQKAAKGESVQKVPVAISAFDSSALARGQLTNLTEVGRISPGTQLMEPGVPGFANFFIRGVGLVGSVRTLDPAVSITVDGMPQEFALGTILDVEDAERVEILRGPQGILFGRNATGGAVSLTTKRPTNDLRIEASARIGNGGRFDVYGNISGPIAGDTILGKISVSHKHSNGLYRDRNGGTFIPSLFNPSGTDNSLVKNEGGTDIWHIAPALELRATDNLTISLLGDYRLEKGDGLPTVLRSQPSNLSSPNFFGYTPDLNNGFINHDAPGDHRLETKRLIGEIALETDYGVFTSITGYRDVEYSLRGDVDGIPFTIFHFPDGGNVDDSEQVSQELRFASTFSDVFRFTVGGYYSELDFTGSERRLYGGFLLGLNPAFRQARESSWEQSGTTKALFYNIDYNIMPSLRLSHGGRYTKDKKTFTILPLRACANPDFTGCQTTFATDSGSWDDFSPKFGAEWQATRDTLLYATWTRGYRSGNYNSRAPNLDPSNVLPADPESIKQIELGLKTTFWDGRARVNLAAFTSKYADIQRTVIVNSFQTLANAASAKVKGLEAEVSVEPVNGLLLSGNIGYTHARYDSFDGLDVNGDGIIDPELAADLKFEQVPEWTGFAEASYTFSLPGVSQEFTARTSYSYKSFAYGDTINLVPIKAHGLLNASFSMRGTGWTAGVYGKNLTNEFNSGQSSAFNFGPGPFGSEQKLGLVYWGNAPREYGLELRFEY